MNMFILFHKQQTANMLCLEISAQGPKIPKQSASAWEFFPEQKLWTENHRPSKHIASQLTWIFLNDGFAPTKNHWITWQRTDFYSMCSGRYLISDNFDWIPRLTIRERKSIIQCLPVLDPKKSVQEQSHNSWTEYKGQSQQKNCICWSLFRERNHSLRVAIF